MTMAEPSASAKAIPASPRQNARRRYHGGRIGGGAARSAEAMELTAPARPASLATSRSFCAPSTEPSKGLFHAPPVRKQAHSNVAHPPAEDGFRKYRGFG